MTATQYSSFKHDTLRAEAFLKQLANANRLMILCSLMEGEKSVSELVEATIMSPSAISQHLAKLKNEKLIECDKRGRKVFYRLKSREVIALLSTLYLIYCRD